MDEPVPASSLHRFFIELRRRRVIRVAIVYAVAGWVIVEVASTVLPPLNLPEWSVKLVIVLVALGFPIAVIMGWMFDLGPDGAERTTAVARPTEPEAAASLALTPAAIAGQTMPPASHSIEDRRTIAVLPFVNMSGDSENEYFSDGISEEILNLLAKLPQLKVSSRTSSFNLKGEKVDIPTAARQLGVSTILEGSVRRAGDRVRITAQLIETASDSHLWSETYDRELKDVFAIQDDIARSIAEALQVALGPKERRALQNIATADPQAYDFYLKGRKYLYAIHPTRFPACHQHVRTGDRTGSAVRAGACGQGRRLFHAVSLCRRHARERRRGGAGKQARDRTGSRLGRSADLIRHGFVHQRPVHGCGAALRDGDPDQPQPVRAVLLLWSRLPGAGQFREGVQVVHSRRRGESRRLPAPVVPQHGLSVHGPCGTGQAGGRARARDHRAPCEDEPGRCARPVPWCQLAGRSGQRERAIEWAELALQSRDNEPHFLYNTACVYVGVGETDHAIDLLERAVALGWGDRAWIENDSDLMPLRSDPRFLALLDRMR